MKDSSHLTSDAVACAATAQPDDAAMTALKELVEWHDAYAEAQNTCEQETAHIRVVEAWDRARYIVRSSAAMMGAE